MRLKRIILSILAILPFKAVAFAAESRLTTEAGSNASSSTDWNKLIVLKALFFEPMAITTTREQAFERFVDKKGLRNSLKAEAEFKMLIEKMLEEGLIQADEKMIVSEIPSRY